VNVWTTIIVLGGTHLRRVLKSYADYYNSRQNASIRPLGPEGLLAVADAWLQNAGLVGVALSRPLLEGDDHADVGNGPHQP
jgi:hypothetical protein